MTDPVAISQEAQRFVRAFEGAGAELIDTDVLQPAEVLLDLYGEDMRARAFVSSDPLRGEVMLRPDFTVPVVQMHLAGGASQARYTYQGKVFRQQADGSDRPAEYQQVGFELFNGDNPVDADAEVFALFDRLLTPMGLRAATGDIGILRAAVMGLETSENRRAALLRHLWRPRRFRALLERFSNPLPARAPVSMIDAPEIGLRSRAEVEARLAAQAEDACVAAISAGQAELVDIILGLKEEAPIVLSHLNDLVVDMPAIAPAVASFSARLDALSARGIDVETLAFEASYGRTALEYYDGFVFGFYAPDRPDLPPVATGGRYDALTRALGGSEAPRAVGGVIRPGLIVELGLAP
ncbi:MAG: ATP phosphoribosyltransferase regulatory subunit [Rhodobacteraceae bacterium]|nr:ATP phosphoribosyltransferase regulatory subunit [Alphaproteobacteria bacterium]NNF73118.1 ATP phosphoribosyltransferase regulatory subunit [Paracoccaceae bacterium]NNK67602.1 ATP phosphoribosyltransferase regulatory subunit [Paracoccaceae bacterium]